jgi:histone acetyltransferase MYST1
MRARGGSDDDGAASSGNLLRGRRLTVGAACRAKASFDDEGAMMRAGEIVDAREEAGSGEVTAYYVHDRDLNKRLDEWVRAEDVEARRDEDGAWVKATREGGGVGSARESGGGGDARVGDGSPEGEKPPRFGRENEREETSKTVTRNSKRRYNEIHNVDAPVEDLPPMDQMFERIHEEKTKVKNVQSIELGRHEMDTWYYSPYPEDFGKCSKLYVCQYCFKYMRKAKTLGTHKTSCEMKHPPGKRIYRHPQGEGKPVLSFWEVDGAKFKMYCQNLCLLAKLFLDHKTLYFDVEPFMFYVLTESSDGDETHDVVGYFSKEKVSVDEYNLACILTLPAYQRKGYGSFLISMSYELSRRQGIYGTPERPLSDLGQVSYRSYWSRVVLDALHKHRGNLSVKDLSAMLMFREADIVSALQSLNLVKYWKGQHIISTSPKIVEEHMRSFQKKSAVAGLQLEFNPELLNWAPLAK